MADKILLTDVDGVLLDWESKFENFVLALGYNFKPNHEFMYSISDQIGVSKEEGTALIAKFNRSSDFESILQYRDSAWGIEKLKSEGHTVEAVEFPYLDYLVPVYYVLTTAEASSNLARYDGIGFGYRSKNATDLESTYKKSRAEGFGTEVKRRIMLGTFVLSSGYYDAYYSKGQKVRRLLQNKTNEILNNYDFIILPTTPGTAFKFGEHSADPIEMYLEDIFTVQANITGIPAISLPLGKHSNGLPFGIQVLTKHFAEAQLFAFSEYLMANYSNLPPSPSP